jgi:predicted HAD superfamily Cof-like phosphohydrolase
MAIQMQQSIPPLPKLSHYIPTIDLVRQFHEVYRLPIAKQLTAGDAKLRRLRVALIAEELCELAQALGVSLELEVKPARQEQSEAEPKRVMNGMYRKTWIAPAELCYADEHVDMVEAADALGDLDYVVQGGNIVFGIPAGLVMYDIHVSNLSKLDENGQPIYDEHGKVVKGPNFKEPDIKAVLDTFDPSTEL